MFTMWNRLVILVLMHLCFVSICSFAAGTPCHEVIYQQASPKSRWNDDLTRSQLEGLLLSSKVHSTTSLKKYLESRGFVYDAASLVWLVELDRGVFAVKRQNGDEEGVGEVSAYRFNKYLGLDIVPPTVRRKIAGKWYTLQFFVEGNPKFMGDTTTIDDVEKVVSKEDFSDMNILAFVVGQYDNHRYNMIVDKNNRLAMFDFETIRVIHQVRYGDFPFVRRGKWTEKTSSLDKYETFPFDKASNLTNPSMDEMREVFSGYWPDALISTFHRYVRHMPNKELNYLRWRGFIWVQNKVASRRAATTNYLENPTLKKVAQIRLKDLRKIFPKPVFTEKHLELNLLRAKALLRALKY